MTNYKDIKRIPIVAADVPNLAASKITSGTLDNARITLDAAEIPNLDTAKVTSGTFANARISTGSVTQHVAATDLTPVRQDITTLALKQAVNENKAAFNLPNSFIDQFEDDTGIGTETNGDRNSLEYWGTVVSSGAAIKDDAWSSESWDYTKSWNLSNDNSALQSDSSGSGYTHWGGAGWDLKSTKTVAGIRVYQNASSSYMQAYNVQTSTDNVTWYTQTGQQDGSGSHTASPNAPNTNTWFKFLFTTDGVETPASARYVKTTMTSVSGGNGNMGLKRFHIYKSNLTANATGTLIGTANVPSAAQTKVSGVALYKDSVGTATIGTDLKIYFTCNGGTNWTEVPTYTAVTPLFSTGIKMLKLAETTCTSGSDVRYKAVWANQSLGSKETQLQGIGINY